MLRKKPSPLYLFRGSWIIIINFIWRLCEMLAPHSDHNVQMRHEAPEYPKSPFPKFYMFANIGFLMFSVSDFRLNEV